MHEEMDREALLRKMASQQVDQLASRVPEHLQGKIVDPMRLLLSSDGEDPVESVKQILEALTELVTAEKGKNDA